MAEIIGSLRRDATQGEKQFLEVLRKLPGEFKGWIELPVGNSSYDFVILHPELGLFFLEVKDYRTIVRSDVDQIRIKRTDGSEYSDINPVRELREKAEKKVDQLRMRWELQDSKGRLIVPWTYGVAFPNLPAKALQLHEALSRYTEDRPCVIAKGDMQSPGQMFALLKRMAFQFKGFQGLNDRQLKAIQAALHKEVVVVDEGEELSIADSEQQDAALRGIFEELRTETSREGDKAAARYRLRLVRGVAGSGKTFVLGLRACHLHRLYPDWEILVLTRNYLLANNLRRRLQSLRPRVQVWHWHALARHLLQLADPPISVEEYGGSREGIVVQALKRLQQPTILSDISADYLAKEIEWIKDTVPLDGKTLQIERESYLKADRTGRVRGLTAAQREMVFDLFKIYESILKDVLRRCDYQDHALLLQKAILLGNLAGGRFDAALMDEAQDFAPAWFAVIKQMLRGDTVFMAADPAQRVFGSFSWRELDFEVVGRSQILKRPYRNTFQIFITAHEFARHNDALLRQLVREGTALLEPVVIASEMRPGDWPTVKGYTSIDEELKQVEREVQRLQKVSDSRTGEQRYALHHIAVLMPTDKSVEKARNYFTGKGVRVSTPEVSEQELQTSLLAEDHLNITNLQKVRGLEFRVVFMCQLQALPPYANPEKASPQEEEDKLIDRSRWLYVGMTRAREVLHLSYQGPPPAEMQSVAQVVAEQKAKHAK